MAEELKDLKEKFSSTEGEEAKKKTSEAEEKAAEAVQKARP